MGGLAGCLDGPSGPTTPATDRTTGSPTAADATTTTPDRTDTATPGETDGTPTETEPGPPDTETPEPTTTIHASYDTTAVDVTTPSGELLGSVTAAIADTPDLRYLGLSDTPSMPDDRGMLFVYDAVSDHTFVMREMSFGLDIVYADADGTITKIHHAPEPGPDENGNAQQYPGRGQYVLEVNIDWTTERGVSEGDVLDFSL